MIDADTHRREEATGERISSCTVPVWFVISLSNHGNHVNVRSISGEELETQRAACLGLPEEQLHWIQY